MKKNKTILIVTAIMAVLAIALYFTNNNGTIKKELKDFAVKDTASIDKIFLADKSGKKVTLTRVNGEEWKVNGKYRARRDAIKTLLYTIHDLDVQSPVAKSAYNNVLKQLATGGVKVEIYQKGELAKTYYVGGTTQDQLGTFMLLENSNTPFVMQIPGFQGYLSSRYFTNELDWRDQLIFKYNPQEIKLISLEFPFKNEESFKIEKKDSSFVLEKIDGKEISRDQSKIIPYVAGFKQLYLEFYTEHPNKDSLLKATPVAVMNVEDSRGKHVSLKFFKKPNEGQMVNAQKKLYQYDPERLYAQINGANEVVIIQNFAVDKLLKNPDLILNPRWVNHE